MQVMLAIDRPYIPLFNPQVVDMVRENVTLPYFPIFDGIPGKAGFQNDARVLIK
jgi:hypothetical protein